MDIIGNDANIQQATYHLLTKTFILLDDYDRQFFAEYGLSTRQFWALQHLDEEQGRSMVELSRVLFTDKSNVTGIVDRLERLKLVTRTMDPRDRRVMLITLTLEGRNLRNRVKTSHDEHIRNLISVLNNDDLHRLLAYLNSINRRIETRLEQGEEGLSHLNVPAALDLPPGACAG